MQERSSWKGRVSIELSGCKKLRTNIRFQKLRLWCDKMKSDLPLMHTSCYFHVVSAGSRCMDPHSRTLTPAISEVKPPKKIYAEHYISLWTTLLHSTLRPLEWRVSHRPTSLSEVASVITNTELMYTIWRSPNPRTWTFWLAKQYSRNTPYCKVITHASPPYCVTPIKRYGRPGVDTLSSNTASHAITSEPTPFQETYTC